MIKQIKVVILLSVYMMCNAAFAAQSDLNASHLASLQEAYKHVLAKDYDVAKDLYRKIQTTDGIETGLIRAAVEGEGLALLLDLNERVTKAKGNDIKLRLLRNRRRTTVSYLEKATKKYQDETLTYFLALAKEESEVSDKTFTNLGLADEYSRLLTTTPVAVTEPVVVVIKKTPPPKKPVIKTVVANETKVTIVKTTTLPNVKYRATAAVQVRSGPGTKYPSIATLEQNQDVVVIEFIRLSNNQVWLKLKKGARIGYTSANFLTKVTKASRPSKNTTGAKTVKAPPVKRPTIKKAVTTKVAPLKKIPPKKIPPKKTTQQPVKSTGSNKACSGGKVIWYFAKEDVVVFASPGGKRRLTYKKNNRIPVAKILPSYLVVKVGQSCGYIIKDSKKLKRVTK